MARELSQAELADLKRMTERAEAKPPPPISMSAVLARGFVAGVGVVLLLGGWLYWSLIPSPALAAGVIVTGAIMLLSTFPTEKIGPTMLTANRIMQVQATVGAAEFRKQKAYEVVLEKEREIAELRQALVEARSQNKVLRAELKIAGAGRENPRWTPRSKVDAETRKHAETILQHWFTTLRTDAKGNVRGEWWSRPKATNAGWTKAQHEEAAELLEDAGLTGQNGLLPFVLPDVADLADAMNRLDEYCLEVEMEPNMPRPYVESDREF